MTVLVTNDDGFDSPGLLALARALRRAGHEILVAAPARNMSGASAAIGPVAPVIDVRRHDLPGLDEPALAVDAPPALIVVSALQGAYGAVPDLVVVGVNIGLNLGRAILHSGTVCAALTAQNLGVAAIAVSVDGEDFDCAAAVAVGQIARVRASATTAMVNLNVPRLANSSTAVVDTVLAKYGTTTAAVTDGSLHFRLVIDPVAFDEPGTDGTAVRDGYISATFLSGPLGQR
jgi:5'-nucleotidase